ncbi:MAG TPA: hypothetical protein VNA25_07100 [Phycisphaerae bacterium]|nr:hypothetical protein [Phycisphaerae bacterium]
MSDHPPIPPNSPFFIYDENAGWYFKWCRYIRCLAGNHSPLTRQIIAAVAEVAWRKEYEQREKRRMDGYSGGVYQIGLTESSPDVKEAKANTRAWRAWGEKGETT